MEKRDDEAGSNMANDGKRREGVAGGLAQGRPDSDRQQVTSPGLAR
jgi:hypothetical protein